MNIPRWVILVPMAASVFVVAASGLARARARYADRIENHKVNVESQMFQEQTLQQEQRKFAALNRNSDRLKEYRNAWQTRYRTYGTQQAIREILRNATAANNLQMVETDETNRVIQNNPADFRVMWRFFGRANNAWDWFNTVQQQIDTLTFESAQFSARADGTVEVRTEAVLRLN